MYFGELTLFVLCFVNIASEFNFTCSSLFQLSKYDLKNKHIEIAVFFQKLIIEILENKMNLPNLSLVL